MALYSERTSSTTRHEYVVPDPVNATEFTKALSAAYQAYQSATGRNVADDSVWVTRADEEIIIYWEENN
jgi:hypothetical protein